MVPMIHLYDHALFQRLQAIPPVASLEIIEQLNLAFKKVHYPPLTFKCDPRIWNLACKLDIIIKEGKEEELAELLKPWALYLPKCI